MGFLKRFLSGYDGEQCSNSFRKKWMKYLVQAERDSQYMILVDGFLSGIIESLPNIKNIKKSVDIRSLAKTLRILTLKQNIDKYGNKEYVQDFKVEILDYVLDENKNSYMYFIKNLNHPFPEKVAKIINSLIINQEVSVYDEWLYDTELFSGNYDEIYKKVTTYISNRKVENKNKNQKWKQYFD